jgi:hypothetical protein
MIGEAPATDAPAVAAWTVTAQLQSSHGRKALAGPVQKILELEQLIDLGLCPHN